MKNKVISFSVFVLIIILFSTVYITCIASASSDWYNDSWSYRIDSVVASPEFPYQMNLTVHAGSGTNNATDVFLNGHNSTNFADIIFTLDNTTELSHWCEDNTTNPINVWINVTANGTVNLYYGNPSASESSDGENTFQLFDNFDRTTLNPTSQYGAVMTAETATKTEISSSGTRFSEYNVAKYTAEMLWSYNNSQYAVFCDNNYNIIAANRTLPSGAWSTSDTGVNVASGDPHRTTSLGIDPDGYIHIAYGHHNDILKYIKSDNAENITSFSAASMTGSDESEVSYPTFFSDGTNLFFAYSDGLHAEGRQTFLNKFNHTSSTWSALHHPFIGDGAPIPYVDSIVRDDFGHLHVSWMWRTTTDPLTNHKVLYAKSEDNGTTWKRTNGSTYSIPISETTAEEADSSGTNTGLLNSNDIAADSSGYPHIVYIKKGSEGYLNYFHTWHNGTDWTIHQITNFSDYTEIYNYCQRDFARPAIIMNGTTAIMLFRIPINGSIYAAVSTSPYTSWDFHKIGEDTWGYMEVNFDRERWFSSSILDIFASNVDGVSGSTPVYVLNTNISTWNHEYTCNDFYTAGEIKWTEHQLEGSSGGSVSVTNSEITISQTSQAVTTSYQIYGSDTFLDNISLRFKGRFPDYTSTPGKKMGGWIGFTENSTFGQNEISVSAYEASTSVFKGYTTINTGTQTNLGITHDPTTNHIYDFNWLSSSSVKFYHDDNYDNESTSNIPTIPLPISLVSRTWSGGNTVRSVIDWIFVRKYVDTPLTWGTWSTESEPSSGNIPPNPTSLANTTGNFWVNYTWSAGSGNTTDSYNVSYNGTWDNTSSNMYRNESVGAHGYLDILVYAYNSSGSGTISNSYITDNVTIPNNAISISGVSTSYTLNEGDTLSIDANYSDVDNDTGTFDDNSTNWNVDSSTGVVSWATLNGDDGTHNWYINVTDGYGSTSRQNFSVTVNNSITDIEFNSANWDETSGTMIEHGDGNLRAPPNVTSGLVSYWSFEAQTGNTAYDVWGTNDGTFTNGVTGNWTTSGINGGGWTGDGVDDVISILNSIDPTNELMMLMWINSSDVDTNYGGQICREAWASNGGYLFSHRGTTSRYFFAVAQDGIQYQSWFDTPLTENVNHHIVGNFNKTCSKLYRDGVLADNVQCNTSLESIINLDDIDYLFGTFTHFNGTVDEVYIFTSSPSDTEINEIKNNYHAASSYREITSSQDAGAGQVWRYVNISGTDAGLNTSGLLQINGSSDNSSWSGWQTVNSTYDINDNIAITAGNEYRYAKLRWYVNTTYQPETDVIEDVALTAGEPNEYPVLLNVSTSYEIYENSTFELDANYTDANGDPVTFTDNSSDWDINSLTGEVSWALDYNDVGVHYYRITVTDDKGGSDHQNFTITIDGVQNTALTSVDTSFENGNSGTDFADNTITLSFYLVNSGSIDADISAKFTSNYDATYGLVSGTSTIGGSNFKLGNATLDALLDNGNSVDLTDNVPGEDTRRNYEVQLRVPAGQNALSYSGTIELTFSDVT